MRKKGEKGACTNSVQMKKDLKVNKKNSYDIGHDLLIIHLKLPNKLNYD